MTPRDPKIQNPQVEIYISTKRRQNPMDLWWFRDRCSFFQKRRVGPTLISRLSVYIYIYVYVHVYIHTIPWNKRRPSMPFIFLVFFNNFWIFSNFDTAGSIKFEFYKSRSTFLQNGVKIRLNFDGFVTVFQFFKNAAEALLLLRGLV